MATRHLTFTARFLSNHKSKETFLEEARNFFLNSTHDKFNTKIQFSSNVVCNYDEVYELHCTITCTNVKYESNVDNYVALIRKNWCTQAKNCPSLHWLISDRNNVIVIDYENYDNFLKVAGFGFGTIPTMTTFVKNYHLQEIYKFTSISCSFSHLQRYFEIYISMTHRNECQSTQTMAYKIKVNYESIHRIVANVHPDENENHIYFHLEYPPFMYVKGNPNKQKDEDNEEKPELPLNIAAASAMGMMMYKWERTFQIGCGCNKSKCTSKRIGKCTVLKLSLNDKYRTRRIIERLNYRCPKRTEICYAFLRMEFIPHVNNDKSRGIIFSKSPFYNFYPKIDPSSKFSCEYAWKSLHSKSYQINDQVQLIQRENEVYVKTLFAQISKLIGINAEAFVKTVYSLSEMVDQGVIFTFQKALKDKFEYFCTNKEVIELPKGICYIRRVLVTPSRIIFIRPCEHMENRIIREFGIEHMLRVTIQDDNFDKLTFGIQSLPDKQVIMDNMVGCILLSGIRIGNRLYEILAASTSQLREHGLWMYAGDPKRNTAASIREWMGDFSSIKNVAKYMARMGQCLSTTEESIQLALDNSNDVELREATTEDGKYIFSDGIGTISSSLAQEVRKTLKENSKCEINDFGDYEPSAFQIRYKGCKGMVAEDPSLPGRAIGIRPSMKKFECSTSSRLEIVKISAPRKLYLNKHLITILEVNKIPCETFMKLQVDMIIDLLDSLTYENKAASALLHNVQVMFPFSSIQKSGIVLTSEPFFRSLLLAIFKASVEKLRTHSRIAIPEKWGRNMFGVLDETGTLKYGEVFVRYSESTSNPGSNKFHVLRGPVIVTKNPCLHPGDVRRLKAVNTLKAVTNLSHHKDVIVFPREGKRPHPDEMAGSDLDGDEYVVLWHKDLIFQHNVKPMTYPSYSTDNEQEKIEMKDVVKFFCEYIQNDNIGVFANAHLAWADKCGIFCRPCKKIVEDYPYVLDFAKNGYTKRLPKWCKPKQYPDFMQKGVTGNTYASKKALGSVYRVSRLLDACASKIDTIMQVTSFDKDLEYPGWQQYEESAEAHRQKYADMLTAILDQHGIHSEAELFTGNVQLQVYKNWREENINAVNIIIRCIKYIMVKFNNIFLREVEEERTNDELAPEVVKEKQLQRASAWYMVTYTKEKKNVLSFPWILSDFLIEIKTKNFQTSHRQNACSFLHDIDSDIEECILLGILNLPKLHDCACMVKSKAILFQWLNRSGLNIETSEKEFCNACFDRILIHFLETTQLHCCSASADGCSCVETCSPTNVILSFLKFYLNKVMKPLGSCANDCPGFAVKNLHALVIQTLTNILVTRNILYLQLDFSTRNDMKSSLPSDTDDSIHEGEGDPIKIPVTTEPLKKLIENYMDDVKAYLKKISGVQKVFIKTERDIFNNPCLVINAIGKNWQRWNLEEIVLDPELDPRLQGAIQVSPDLFEQTD